MLGNSSACNPSLDEAKEHINNLDLTCVINRMSADPHKTGWVRKEAVICCRMYKNYLFLLKKYPSKVIPPSKQIDEFWHQHILFTRRYHEDSIKIFGKYLHHQPGEGTRESIKYFRKLFDEVTQELYFSEYGEYL